LQVLPYAWDSFDRTIYYCLERTTTRGNISIEIGTQEYYYDQSTRGVYVSIVPAWTTPAANHTVWVDYDAEGHSLSIYINSGGMPKPGHAMLHTPLDIEGIVGRGNLYKYFSLFASKNRSLPSCQLVIYSWNVTANRLVITSTGDRCIGWLWPIALSPVPLAAIIFMVLRWSRLASWYRALIMKLKLSRVLRRLPGIPREFKFADVKKATRNYHNSNRLGRGGFGTVYKGTMLISATSAAMEAGWLWQRRRYLDVALKKFTRKEDHSYDDFLDEVTIINLLRHKNIVPLLGAFRSSLLSVPGTNFDYFSAL
jgi:hypothetical protein